MIPDKYRPPLKMIAQKSHGFVRAFGQKVWRDAPIKDTGGQRRKKQKK